MEQLRLLTLIVAIIGLAAVIQAALRHRKRFWYVVPAVLYLGHLGLFYFVRVMDYQSIFGIALTPANINLWSVSIHIQAALTITIKAVTMINGKILGDI
jgi:predicted membrane protein